MFGYDVGMNSIEWKIKAVKQLKRIPADYRSSIIRTVEGLVDFPEGNSSVKALKNHACGYRLRVGRYRVLFNHDGTIHIVTIEEVRKRDEQTY
jgi:mRNA-degrading endonuclease RelE of RelBE toxin-antitoxin system